MTGRLICKDDNALGLLVSRHLILSGTYILYTGSKDRLVKAWEEARGINFAIGVYAKGAKAHYFPIPLNEYKLSPEKMYENPGY